MKIQEILKQPEDKSLEFKKEIPKNRLNLLKTVVGFANGSGGHIYVGVNDDRTITGKSPAGKTKEKIGKRDVLFNFYAIIPIM